MERFGYSIFCDDIRYEIGGKVSFIGSYTNLMVVWDDFPATLTKLCIAATVITPIDDPYVGPMSIQVTLPGDKDGDQTFYWNMEAPPLEQIGRVPPSGIDGAVSVVAARAAIVLSPLVLRQSGAILVRAINGDRITKLGSIRVMHHTEGTEAGTVTPDASNS